MSDEVTAWRDKNERMRKAIDLLLTVSPPCSLWCDAEAVGHLDDDCGENGCHIERVVGLALREVASDA